MKKAVIFDLDGTLADTIDDIAGAVNRTLSRRNLREHDPESEDYIESTRAEAAADYAGRCLERTRAYPGVSELLAALSARGVRAAILSNKPDALTRKCADGLFPNFSFAFVRGETPEFPRKPDPASALDICARLGVAPADALYLGDSGVDMRTAKAAGLTALGALWGFRSEAELREGGADALLASPLDLLQYL
jgi:phosphoglycolate phosphatase